jgi:Secretion system C-terminal sorting domain
MKKLYAALFFYFSFFAFISAQTITNAEDFSIGNVLKFVHCDSTGVYAGSSGNNVTWNFSSLIPIPSDTETEWMVTPASTTHGGLFPGANQVEKYSNGQFVYVNKSAGATYLVGFVDTVNNIVLHYYDSMLFALRPISYGSTTIDTFKNKFSSGPYNFSGGGTSTIHADGYGTLILPTGTYTNVLRVTIIQSEIDTLLNPHSTSVTTTVSHAWFDGVHTSSLLKIDSTKSSQYATKTVQYLADEITGVNEITAFHGFSFWPNPAQKQIVVTTPQAGKMMLFNELGQEVANYTIKSGAQTTISVQDLPPGIYCLLFQTETYKVSSNLIVSH